MSSFRRRMLVVFLALWCGAIAVRLVGLQVVEHGFYVKKADLQQQREVTLHPARGTIYDAAGRELAVSMQVESAWADPELVDDPRATARAVAALVPGVDSRQLAAAFADRSKAFVWVERKLDPPVARALAAKKLPGVFFLRESKRYYPNRELAAAVLGYVGTDNEGLGGLEHYYDKKVTGRAGRRVVVLDARRDLAVDPKLAYAGAESGFDLTLTLDASLQYFAERELAAAVETHHAAGGSAVLLDPTTGAVLAMASYPGFDPNRFNEYPASSWRNRAVMDAYEPGSTFKMVTAAAALAGNVFDPNDLIDCELGGITLAGTRIRDHKKFGRLSFRDVIARSSNVGAIKIGLRVGPERMERMVRDLGFGERTGIDLPGESPGLLRPAARWTLRGAYVAFGQEISITPLQLAVAFAAVANGGTRVRPYLVASATGPGGERVVRPGPQVEGRPLSDGTARELERILEAVVAEGTGRAAAIPGYPVAGKTGTAQKAVDGLYSGDRFVASFVGFAPARRPAVVGVVVLDEPRPLYHGGQVAAPAFAAMVAPALLYLGVPPERERPEVWPGQRKPGVELAALRSPAVPPPGEDTW